MIIMMLLKHHLPSLFGTNQSLAHRHSRRPQALNLARAPRSVQTNLQRAAVSFNCIIVKGQPISLLRIFVAHEPPRRAGLHGFLELLR